jgi:hypothetical protein
VALGDATVHKLRSLGRGSERGADTVLERSSHDVQGKLTHQ